jgi:antirestriction protein ArdC
MNTNTTTNRKMKQDAFIASVIDAFSTPEKWRKTWITPAAKSLSTGKHYDGVNLLSLKYAAIEKGFGFPLFGTYEKLKDMGLQVRKGETGTTVVYWFFIEPDKATKAEREAAKEEGETLSSKRIPVLKMFTVFNIDQVDVSTEDAAKIVANLKRVYAIEKQVLAATQAEKLEAFRASQTVPIKDGPSACYRPSAHEVIMPAKVMFQTDADYWRTLFHELIHSTAKTLGREQKGFFGDPAYAFEELVAELGSLMLCQQFGIESEPSKESIGYLQSWARLMEDKPKAIMSASSLANKAVKALLGETA